VSNKWWTSGNGQGSEKHDAYWEIAHDAKTSNEFDTKSRQPWLPSDNGADGEPKHHNNGFTTAQIKSHYIPDPNPYAYEKADAFWTIGKETPTTEKFDHESARGVWIPSQNHGDSTPTGHPNGIGTAQVHRHKHHHKKHIKDLSQLQWWTDGNNGGSEKQDVFWDMAHASHSESDFEHKAARELFLPSTNKADRAPAAHPNGFTTLQLDADSKYSDYWRFLDFDSKTTEEFNKKARKPEIDSDNRLDAEP